MCRGVERVAKALRRSPGRRKLRFEGSSSLLHALVARSSGDWLDSRPTLSLDRRFCVSRFLRRVRSFHPSSAPRSTLFPAPRQPFSPFFPCLIRAGLVGIVEWPREFCFSFQTSLGFGEAQISTNLMLFVSYLPVPCTVA